MIFLLGRLAGRPYDLSHMITFEHLAVHLEKHRGGIIRSKEFPRYSEFGSFIILTPDYFVIYYFEIFKIKKVKNVV